MNNISFTYGPKGKNPDTDEWDYKYLVPAIKEQQGVWNYIVVTCSPQFNGVYRWNHMDKSKCKAWMNGKLPCYYVPIDICTFKRFDELDMDLPVNQKIIEEVKKQQAKWFKGEVKGKDAYKKKKPDWML